MMAKSWEQQQDKLCRTNSTNCTAMENEDYGKIVLKCAMKSKMQKYKNLKL